ncbi:MAG: hypothetical protein KAS94_05150 [Desulfobulbaceae bacterium]|nr:hypothetical protein [Desulfobulbaceae bacterium]
MIRASGALLLLLTILCRPGPAQGFYEYQGRESSLELSGFVGVGAGQLTYPADSNLYDVRDDQAWSGDLRLLIEAGDNDGLHLSANVLQSSRAKVPFIAAVSDLIPLDVQRSSLLTWDQHDSRRSRSELLVDNLHLQYRTSRLDLAVGRQPINLATTFYFVPNDFFAPFAPQTFFRTYKAGVDGLRADFRLAELSQLTCLGVLAYDRDGSTANGWGREPVWSETSLLIRASREMGHFEWAVLVGTVDENTISGASLQGELFNLVGLRAEGHYGAPEKAGGSSYFKLAVGLEKVYANNFSWRLEYFQNSAAGLSNVSSLPATTALNRDYGALGLGYELTPLLNGSFLVLVGFNDDSGVLSANLLYSLSDEAELSLLASVPFGDSAGPTSRGSEFASQARMILLEWRYYF